MTNRNGYQMRYKLDLKSDVKMPILCVVMLYGKGNVTNPSSL